MRNKNNTQHERNAGKRRNLGTKDHPDRLCSLMARRQHGVFTAAQAEAAGLSRKMLFGRTQRGQLERVLPGIYTPAGTPESLNKELMAAVLYLGEGSAASHTAAAWKWSMDGIANPNVEVSTVSRKSTGGRTLPSGREIIVHRVDRYILEQIVHVGEMPVTSVPKTFMDIACRTGLRTGRLLDHALRDGVTTLGQMWLFYENEWIRGRRGVAVLRNLLIERTADKAPTDSELEDLMWDVIENAGLPKPEVQYETDISSGRIRIDFAYPDTRIAMECDSIGWHLGHDAFERDRERDIELQAQGWIVLRFTWAMLRYRPHFVADQIKGHLEARPRN